MVFKRSRTKANDPTRKVKGKEREWWGRTYSFLEVSKALTILPKLRRERLFSWMTSSTQSAGNRPANNSSNCSWVRSDSLRTVCIRTCGFTDPWRPRDREVFGPPLSNKRGRAVGKLSGRRRRAFLRKEAMIIDFVSFVLCNYGVVTGQFRILAPMQGHQSRVILIQGYYYWFGLVDDACMRNLNLNLI